MKAMIFAAGLGTRLKPFTLEHPKALVPVAGVPMLQRVILKIKDAGISEMVVNVHHFASQIVDFLMANDSFGCDIRISDETDRLLDTGGGILKARRWLDCGAPVLVHNADILTDFPLSAMIDAHLAAEADATLLAGRRDTSRYLLFDNGGRMHGWVNRITGEVRPGGLATDGLAPLAFGGVHIVSPTVFPALGSFPGACSETGEPQPFSITDFYIREASSLLISAFMPAQPYHWHDVGKPEALADAERQLSVLS